ncbi:MAG TPA: methionyl-tRNA formyltransferase [Bacillota bacterium]|nr:methionyl-tRNA formyltransferase [Bacillota bacterium]
MNIVFMGTPDFAVPCLEVLVREGHRVAGVITQPDRPKGRGKQLVAPPVKVKALELGLPVYQPDRIKTPEFVEVLRGLTPDLIVVVAFGQLLSRDILDLPPHGCINVHASLLPRYRGAAPIHRAILEGEQETGVTIMYMDTGLDTGDMILQEKVPIEDRDTLGTVHDKLAETGARLLALTVKAMEAGQFSRTPQDGSLSTYAGLLTRADEKIDWHSPASEIFNRIRGLNPWPGAFTMRGEQLWKIWQSDLVDTVTQGNPGEIVEVSPKEGIVVQTGQGLLRLTELQKQGGKRLKAADFARGQAVQVGMLLE